MTQYVNFYNYLFSASTPEELKKRYIELIKTNHPDKGGSVETCQEINAIFDKLQHHPKFNGKHQATEEATEEKPQGVGPKTLEIIANLAGFEGLHLEICGSWLWVTGDTWNYRAELKSQGLKWASNKKAWFFHEYEWTRKNRHSMTMDEIRENHGSEKIKEVKRQRIA